MRIDTKYNLEQEIAVVYDGVPCNGIITGIYVHTDMRIFMVKYEVEVSKYPDIEVGTFTYDENHIYKDRHCREISIEIASLLEK